MAELSANTESSRASRLWRWGRVLVVRGLIVIGAIWVGAHGFIWLAKATRSYWRSDTAAASFSSPDGEFKAVVFVSMGGGPGTSYCGTSVYVVASAVSGADIGGDLDRVYVASCGGLAGGHWDQNIIWKSEHQLEIAFDPSIGVTGSTGKVIIKGFAADGEVLVRYVFKQGGEG